MSLTCIHNIVLLCVVEMWPEVSRPQTYPSKKASSNLSSDSSSLAATGRPAAFANPSSPLSSYSWLTIKISRLLPQTRHQASRSLIKTKLRPLFIGCNLGRRQKETGQQKEGIDIGSLNCSLIGDALIQWDHRNTNCSIAHSMQQLMQPSVPLT
jgi:hypothetical protein